MFSENLHTILHEIFDLVSKLHFDANYVELLPPVERELYLMYAKEEKAEEAKRNQPKDMLMGQPIDPMMNPLNGPRH